MLTSWKKSYDHPREHIEKQTLLCQQRSHLVKAMIFPMVMLDVKVGLQKKLSAEELEETLESPLD